MPSSGNSASAEAVKKLSFTEVERMCNRLNINSSAEELQSYSMCVTFVSSALVYSNFHFVLQKPI